MHQQVDPPLSAYQWQNRLIILYAPVGLDSLAQQQESWLFAQTAGLQDRDIVVIRLQSDQVWVDQHRHEGLNASQIRQYYQVSPETFSVMLIGKDGGLKWRGSAPQPPAAFFERIDVMPMRRQEIRRKHE